MGSHIPPTLAIMKHNTIEHFSKLFTLFVQSFKDINFGFKILFLKYQVLTKDGIIISHRYSNDQGSIMIRVT